MQELLLQNGGCENEQPIRSSLTWCFNNTFNFNITSVVMSFHNGFCGSDFVDTEIQNLINTNISLFAASGNQAKCNDLGYPACNSNVIAIGATYDFGDGTQEFDWCTNTGGVWILGSCVGGAQPCKDFPNINGLSCWTNRNEELDLLAPGSSITSTQLGNGFIAGSGTSQAPPHVAGVAALLLEKDPTKSPQEIEAILHNSGVPVYDSKTGLTFRRVNALAAINSICKYGEEKPQSCGYGICEDYEMGYTRNCDGDTCGGELDCRDDSSCSGSAPSGVDFCDFDDLSCDKFYTESGSAYCDESDDYYECEEVL